MNNLIVAIDPSSTRSGWAAGRELPGQRRYRPLLPAAGQGSGPSPMEWWVQCRVVSKHNRLIFSKAWAGGWTFAQYWGAYATVIANIVAALLVLEAE